MSQVLKKCVLVLSAFFSAGVAITTSGCASGGYQLSRGLAGWINKQGILIRILLYLFIGGAFFFTILADLIFFNTVDFWSGKVSQGTYEFKDADKTFVVKHSFEGELRRTEIQIHDLKGKKLQGHLLKETADHQIEYFVDGTLKAKFDGIESVPKVTLFDAKGKITKQEDLPAFTNHKLVAR